MTDDVTAEDEETHITESVPSKKTQIKHKNEVLEKYNNIKVLPKILNSTNLHLCIIGIIFGIVLEIFYIQNINTQDITKPKYWVFISPNISFALKHIHLVIERFGYSRTTNETPWDLLWSHPYPFDKLHLKTLKPHQKVNHFPGIDVITSKVSLATINSKYIPKAFRLPQDKEELLKYASENQKSVFVEKNKSHRGVVLKNVTELDEKGGKFVQEYVPNPFLVDGYKFDLGVFVVITSVDPLRVYYYNGDVLFRFCPEKYYPFDPKNASRKKYVIEENYRLLWEVPALKRIHSELGYSMKDSFDIYVRSQGKNPTRIWEEVNKAIMEIFTIKEKHIIQACRAYASKDNFFQLVRVDLLLDEDLNVHLLEANLGPNLYSLLPPYQLLNEQVLYNLFSIVGLSSLHHSYRSSFSLTDCGTISINENYVSCNYPPTWKAYRETLKKNRPLKNYNTHAFQVARSEIRNSLLEDGEKQSGADMISAATNIYVWGDECNSSCVGLCDGVCALCHRCLTLSDRDFLLQAYREHINRGDFRRIFPPPLTQNTSIKNLELEELNPKNRLLYLWYQGKCNSDLSWCT